MRHKWVSVDGWGRKDQCSRCSLIRYKQAFKNTRFFRVQPGLGEQRAFLTIDDKNSCTPVSPVGK